MNHGYQQFQLCKFLMTQPCAFMHYTETIEKCSIETHFSIFRTKFYLTQYRKLYLCFKLPPGRETFGIDPFYPWFLIATIFLAWFLGELLWVSQYPCQGKETDTDHVNPAGTTGVIRSYVLNAFSTAPIPLHLPP